jgi:DNA-binding CsgD family transcriptional regulator
MSASELQPVVSTASPGIEPAALFRQARTQPCQIFQRALLRQVAETVDAAHGAINTWHPGGHVASIGLGYDLQAMSDQWHAIGGAALDFLTARMEAQPLRAVHAGPDDPHWAMPGAEVWRNFQHRHDIHHQLGVALHFEGSETRAHLYVNRGRGAAPYTRREADVLTALAPLVAEAMLVNRLYVSVAQGLPLEDDCAAAIVDAHGWILYPNAAFCRAWAGLRATFADNPAPRVPAAWLAPDARTTARLHRCGWRLLATPCEGGSRIALHPLAGAGALTWRQLEIARLYCAGATYKDIGLTLGLSPETVRVHLRNAYRRIGVGSRAKLREALQD